VAYDLHPAPLQTMAGTRGRPLRAVLALIATEACNKFKGLENGPKARYIAELATVTCDLVGVVIATADEKVYAIGDVEPPSITFNHSSPHDNAAKVSYQPKHPRDVAPEECLTYHSAAIGPVSEHVGF
jgi:hypothetical protein